MARTKHQQVYNRQEGISSVDYFKVSRSAVIYQPRTAVHDGMVFILSIAIIHKYLLAISTHNTVLGHTCL